MVYHGKRLFGFAFTLFNHCLHVFDFMDQLFLLFPLL